MSTLSLDLRGVEATHLLPREAPAKGAGLSVSLHIAGITAMILIPLLRATSIPEVAHASAPLIKPITVMLPLSPTRVEPARRVSKSLRPAAIAVAPLTPTETPTSLNVVADLTAIAGPVGDAPSPGGDEFGVTGGDACPLGSLCGAAVAPVDPPTSVVRIGGAIREPRLRESRPPVYPPLAQSAGVSGRVVLEALIGQDGRVREVTITESNSLFDAAALASVRSRRYEPLLLNGVPTDFIVTVTVAFTVRR